MKKEYLKPNMEVLEAEDMTLLASSPIGVYSDNGLKYGGVDEDGDLDPEQIIEDSSTAMKGRQIFLPPLQCLQDEGCLKD